MELRRPECSRSTIASRPARMLNSARSSGRASVRHSRAVSTPRSARSMQWIRSDRWLVADSWGLSMVSRSREARGLGVPRGEDAYGQAGGQAGALAGWAADVQRAADRGDAIEQAAQAGPFGGVGAAGTVVGDRHLQRAVGGRDVHADPVRSGVL